MYIKNLTFGIAILLSSLTLVATVRPISVWAANIDCPTIPEPNAFCFATNDSDNIRGTDGRNHIDALDGDDKVLALGGDDFVSGESGNDLEIGGGGQDVLAGGFDNDRLDGGPGNDNMKGGFGKDEIIARDGNDLVTISDEFNTSPDGSLDFIDCGIGNDEVFINTSTDHDRAINCETVHSG